MSKANVTLMETQRHQIGDHLDIAKEEGGVLHGNPFDAGGSLVALFDGFGEAGVRVA